MKSPLAFLGILFILVETIRCYRPKPREGNITGLDVPHFKVY
jgi:hypothetical protein